LGASEEFLGPFSRQVSEEPVTARTAKDSRKDREDQPRHCFWEFCVAGLDVTVCDFVAAPFPAGRASPATFSSSPGTVRRALSATRYFAKMEEALLNKAS
jgi:hypothetical protein